MNTPPLPILGTAMWGWTTPRERCFEMLDHFYQAGYREVDTATNYPINKNAEDFRLAEKLLLEWIGTHGVKDLKVMMKVGSLNNMMTPDQNLSKSFLLLLLNEYRQFFGDNLDTFMVHWDNRDQQEEIEQTFEAFEEAQQQGLRLGLSGIKHPGLYATVNEKYRFQFRIQIKHNLLQSTLSHYQSLSSAGRFITYGINAGGLKLNPDQYTQSSSLAARGGDIQEVPPIVGQLKRLIQEVNHGESRPAINSMNQCGMVFAYHTPRVEGILLGTSRLSQLKESLSFYESLKNHDYEDFYEKLKQLHEGTL